MSLSNLFINIVFAFILLLINGTLGKWKQKNSDFFNYANFSFDNIDEENFSDCFFQLLIHPALYLGIISWILQLFSLKTIIPSLWLVVPFYWGLRFIVALLRDTISFLNWQLQLILFFISLLLSECTLFVIILPLVEAKKTIFIEIEQFRDAFWFAVFGFVAKFIWDYSKVQMIGRDVFPSSKKSTVIIKRYEKYYHKYNQIVNAAIDRECAFTSEIQKSYFSCLVYTIMILETHNRPFWFRTAEYLVKFFCPNKLMSLGIMQYQTTDYISDNTSIVYAVRKLNSAYKPLTDQNEATDNAIEDYNPSTAYFNEAIEIFDELKTYLNLAPNNPRCTKVKVRKIKP